MSKKARMQELEAEKTVEVAVATDKAVGKDADMNVDAATEPIKPKTARLTIAKLNEKLDEAIRRQTAVVKDLVGSYEGVVTILDDHESRIAYLEGKMMLDDEAKLDDRVEADDEADECEEEMAIEPEPSKQEAKPRGRYDLTDGPHKMWQWWEHERRVWRGPSEAITTALSAVGGDASLVRAAAVWIENGRIDHFLSSEEIEKYLP